LEMYNATEASDIAGIDVDCVAAQLGLQADDGAGADGHRGGGGEFHHTGSHGMAAIISCSTYFRTTR
jgi:hypothetical protein